MPLHSSVVHGTETVRILLTALSIRRHRRERQLTRKRPAAQNETTVAKVEVSGSLVTGVDW